MAKRSTNVSQTDVPVLLSSPDQSDGRSSAKLRGLDSNPQGAFGPQLWKVFRDSVAHVYDTVSLPTPAEEARFTLATRSYATPRGILMRCEGTAVIMSRGPAKAARSADPLVIVLQLEGSVDADSAGRRARREPGDVAISDYARPFHTVSTDYAILIVQVARQSVPTALLALEPHGLIFPRGSGAARLIGAAMQEFYAQADELTLSEAEAAIEGILALTTAFARARLAGDEADHVKARRKAALDHIDAHLANAQLGPGEIADAANLSRASLYRLLAEEGGIRAVLLRRRLEASVRLLLADGKEQRSLTEIAKGCGFGGISQFSRAFRARFGAPPRQYSALVREQGLDWHETRIKVDGFDKDSLVWRHKGLRASKPSSEPDGAD
jgi:AraC-like DNA-binding protein